ncbi:MAG: hypothetical protein ACLPYS_20855 [Vulcanimicrobiaceae bacterium]|jgi:hypothetical protein
MIQECGVGPGLESQDTMQLMVVEAGNVEQQLDLVEYFRRIVHSL